MIKEIEGGVTAAKGFLATGIAAGIKKDGSMDMAMVVSTVPCTAAGTFTTNVVKAAPVIYDREMIQKNGIAQAVVINSGIANACTGKEGLDACLRTAEAASKGLEKFRMTEQDGKPAINADGKPVPAESILVCSTGVIGYQLPIDKIARGAEVMSRHAEGSPESGMQAACAIMTTDTKCKEKAFSFTLSDGTEATIGGMSKGSGMIHPNMCTMLAFVTTDISISRELLQEALSEDIQETYNMISVDGDTSTNDTCLLLANGLAGNKTITEKGADYETFCEALHAVNEALAKKMAADGEGATAMLEVKVTGARTHGDAKILARSVVSSNLTKAALYGHDANWGRILCALGYAGVDFDPEKVDVTIESAAGRLVLVKNEVATDYSEEEATKILSESAVTVTCDMKEGDASATAWGCDLTHKYVEINGDYRS
ncbi:MAG: bifunctional glutamate N-acetyltransferase/amino-acid acetyltransferase ArgJ [Lachnospiraceae bacterium]|jgi:glutamate N-acetyltransferase/amino-acid N-acetyltransferase|nr:bifunctional glutamate N-acetyltransferase/amino-acid acetyltransferase ArgJ [Lachnospiraceae bacterium]MCI1726416.1 bifunctional glutamate N-acetyltransferase/amino-acid acetyltransferase ArgJ [Lachnospiraceae bacterium]